VGGGARVQQEEGLNFPFTRGGDLANDQKERFSSEKRTATTLGREGETQGHQTEKKCGRGAREKSTGRGHGHLSRHDKGCGGERIGIMADCGETGGGARD